MTVTFAAPAPPPPLLCVAVRVWVRMLRAEGEADCSFFAVACVQEMNKHLASLPVHNDIPKIAAAGLG